MMMRARATRAMQRKMLLDIHAYACLLFLLFRCHAALLMRSFTLYFRLPDAAAQHDPR